MFTRWGEFLFILFFVVFAVGILLYVLVKRSNLSNLSNKPIQKNEVIKQHDLPYFIAGIPADDFIIDEGEVQAGNTIAELLSNYNVEDTLIKLLYSSYHQNIEKKGLIVGKPYTALLYPEDEFQVLKYFIYHASPHRSVIFQLDSAIKVFEYTKEVKTLRKKASGIIQSSLWSSIKEQGLNVKLAAEIAEIYAWSVDFFDLKKFDTYKIIYYENFIDDTVSVGVESIEAAWLNHNGKEYYAIYFEQDSLGTFFDDRGKNLKKDFLKAPLKFTRISSKFSNKRLHPILKIFRPHHGIDYAAPIGTPVFSVGEGKIIEIINKGQAGKMLKVQHSKIYSTAYLHLKSYAKGIKKDGRVRQGQIIGYVGSSGISTGPHLDFRFYRSGKAIDPLKVVSKPILPLKKENQLTFDSIQEIRLKELQGIVIP